MRIALCYSGEIREFEKTFQNHIQCLAKNNNAEVNIFAHFWAPEIGNDFVDNVVRPKKVIYDHHENDRFVKEAEAGLSLRKLNIEGSRQKNWPQRAFSMFYGIEKSINLALEYEQANSIKYDFVFRIRTDSYFLEHTISKLDNFDGSVLNLLSRWPEPLASPHRLDILGVASWPGLLKQSLNREQVLSPEKIDDCFAFGDGETMRKYCGVYSNYRAGNIWGKNDHRGDDRLGSPERMLGIQIENNQLKVYKNEWKMTLWKGVLMDGFVKCMRGRKN
jgi:hypothetical protein